MRISITPAWSPFLDINGNANRNQCRAFTIIELAITLLIIGILAGIAAPRFDSALRANRALGAARTIESDLRYAKRVAQQSSTPQTVVFDTVAESYVLSGVDDINRKGETFMVNLSDTKFQAQLVSADFAGSSTVTFDIHGRPDNAGSIVIASGGRTETILIDSEGQVSLQ